MTAVSRHSGKSLSALVLGLCLAATQVYAAEIRMSLDQLRAFVASSKQLGYSDKKVAEYLQSVVLSNRLSERTIEVMQGEGAGPKTVEALRRLSEQSKAQPEAPAPAVVKAPAPIPPPSYEEQQKIIHSAREYALTYSKTLPNFICTQVTRRYVDPSGMEFWQRMDAVTARLSYFEQKEDYKVVLVNDKYVDTTMERLGGATSTGEFGSMLKEIFQPSSQADVHWERWATLRGKRMYVFGYHVDQPQSRWAVRYDSDRNGGAGQVVTPGYHGLIYVDKETEAIMRVTLEGELPASFPVQQAMTTLDYDFIDISGQQFVLPLKAVVRMRASKMLTKNEVEFRLYKKFGAETTITFTPDPLPEDQTQEQKP